MIPLIDLKAQYRSIRHEIDAAVSEVLESGIFILGPAVSALEEEFAAYCGAKYGIGVNSGTSALHLALLAAGIGPGDEVITTPYTFVASVAAIRYTGARPVFVDIEPRSYNLDPSGIEAVLSEKTKAILPIHLYGQAAEMDPILEIARRHNLLVIEDAAQAHGAEYKGRRAGSMGQMACFSFYPTKTLGAYGEGGMVVTDDPEYARAIRLLRDWGTEKKYHHAVRGYNYRLEAIQAAILRVKLKHLDRWIATRQAHAVHYEELLKDLGIETPAVLPDRRHVFTVYAIMTNHRDRFAEALSARQIQTTTHYPFAIYDLAAHSDLGYRHGDYPIAERAAARELSLPLYPELTSEKVEEICRVILEHSVDREFATVTRV